MNLSVVLCAVVEGRFGKEGPTREARQAVVELDRVSFWLLIGIAAKEGTITKVRLVIVFAVTTFGLSVVTKDM